jgi:hypothetical protein
MSNSLDLFGGKGNPLANSDLFKDLLELNKTLAGSGGGGPRISIKGGRFREFIGGEQVRIFKGDQLNVIVLNAGSVGRTYFEGAYDPNAATQPTCWSVDGKIPSPDLGPDDRISTTCGTCPMNIKGSGQGESRACRYNQRLAVQLEGDEEGTVYQMQLPATSLFGDVVGGNMGMQAYAKLLAVHKTPIIAVVTGITFDEDSETPKLYFKPVRPLDEDELRAAVAAKDSDAALAAITMSVSNSDGAAKAEPKKPAGQKKKVAPVDEEEEEEEEVKPKPKPKAKPKPAPVDEDEEEEEVKPKPKAKPKPAPVDEDEEDEGPPKKRTAKPAAAAAPADLASIIGEWDDDDDDDEDE